MGSTSSSWIRILSPQGSSRSDSLEDCCWANRQRSGATSPAARCGISVKVLMCPASGWVSKLALLH